MGLPDIKGLRESRKKKDFPGSFMVVACSRKDFAQGKKNEGLEVRNKKFSRATLKDYLRPLMDKRVIMRVF